MNLRIRKPEQGFTLLETLITLVILGVGVSLTLSLISGALTNIRKVQIRARTIQHAESVMELALLDDSITKPTVIQGDFADGTRWMIRVSEYEMPRPPQPLAVQQQVQMPVKLLAYALEIMAPGSATADLRLQTLKLVNVETLPGAAELPR
ncbi:MAG: type II secretion system protein [Acidobacteria bacterium]|nr:type II secretion system protein [Acidobacteriota bacterium]